MPGMSTGLNADNPTIVSAFKTALFHQGLIVLLLVALVVVAWRLLRVVALRRAAAARAALAAVDAHAPAPHTPPLPVAPVNVEAPARQILRIGFALLWLLDGLLQMQPAMPLGMTTGVVRPVAAASPRWVQDVVNAGTTIWSFHPVTAATAAVWIQLGIGLFLLVAPRGYVSRAAGVTAAVWGTVVWVFGEAFGGLFAPGLSWLFGAPGAVAFYVLAGILVALPEKVWTTARAGRRLLGGIGVFFLFMALLQAWPGRGFWHGTLSHARAGTHLGTLPAMVAAMTTTPQPSALAGLLRHFASFAAAHAFAVNLFVVGALGVLGACLLTGRWRWLRAATIGTVVLALADWVLVEDLGFFGGTGTDPNSMLPLVVVVVAGAVAVRSPAGVAVGAPARAASWTERFTAWRTAAARQPSYVLRLLGALGAVGVVFVGAVPIAVAAVQPSADPLIAAATDGTPDYTHFPAHGFTLTDAAGRRVSLASLRGRTVALTFLDPVCTSDCPIIAQEFKQTDALVGENSGRYVFVAVDANPLYTNRSYLRAFSAQEGMSRLPNWLYLTGSTTALRQVWNDYGVQDQYSPGGAMVAHSDIAYVIDRHGIVSAVLNADVGQGTAAAQSSFAATLAGALERTSRA